MPGLTNADALFPPSQLKCHQLSDHHPTAFPPNLPAPGPAFPPPASAPNVTPSDPGHRSPTAPEFSPISPRPAPALPTAHPSIPPAASHESGTSASTPATHGASTAIAPTEYVTAPPPQPFSSEDSIDAIALRAAISSLQYQKSRAQKDLRTLDTLKRAAVENPDLFRAELIAGRFREEEKSSARDWLTALDSDSSTEAGDEGGAEKARHDGDDEVMADASDPPPFANIPGPQNVVRMPHVNWDKYHIHGPALDALHERQRRWPGIAGPGREFAVAAPYSPWLDDVGRKDSGLSTRGVESEHPMATRKSGARKSEAKTPVRGGVGKGRG